MLVALQVEGISLDTVFTLPPAWVVLVSLLGPVVSAAMVHPSNEDNKLRWLVNLGWVLATVVIEQLLDGVFSINEIISGFTLAVGGSRFLSLETLAHFDLNDKVLPSKGVMPKNPNAYKMVGPTGYEGGTP